MVLYKIVSVWLVFGNPFVDEAYMCTDVSLPCAICLFLSPHLFVKCYFYSGMSLSQNISPKIIHDTCLIS